MEKDGDRQMRLPRQGGDQIGCVWVFISMFNFRHVGSVQRLLADKKRGSRRMSGNGNLGNKLEEPNCSCEDSLRILDGEDGFVELQTDRQSVKKGMSDGEKIQKICGSGSEGSEEKNRKRRSRKSKSNENIKSLVVVDEVAIEGCKGSEHQSASGLQEFKGCIDNAEQPEEQIESDEVNGDYGEKLRYLIKRLLTEKGCEIQSCKELLEAFQVLGYGEESFLKVSDESAQSFGSSQRMEEEEDLNTVEEVRAAAVSEVLVGNKKRKFFSKKARSREKSSAVQSSSSQVTKNNVVLKPESKSLDFGSSSETELHLTNNKTKHGTIGSLFLLTGIKRRLKSAIRKEPRDMSQNRELEELFSCESTAGASVGEANREEDDDAREKSKNNTYKIYIEAKKHLSEMLANENKNVKFSSNEVPRNLGRILSLPEFSSPVSSPESAQGHDFIIVDNKKQEHLPNTLSQNSENPEIQHFNSEDCSERPHEQCSNDPVDEDSTKPDETLSARSVQIPQDITDEEEDSDVLDPLSGQCNSSNLQNVTNVDDEKPKMHYEERDKERSKESQTPSSPLESPPNSSVRMMKCRESTAATDVTGKSSPVSVLEPPFTEDDTSPTSSKSHFVEIRMQPLCLKFDEPEAPDKDNNVKTTMDAKESTFAYIEAVVKASGLNRNELYLKSFHSDQLLDPPLMEGIEFCSNKLCDDEKLLFDCINEVLMELCGHEFCSHGPWISSSIKSTIKLTSNIENIVKEVQERVYWHLTPLPFPHTLDHIVRKDMTKTTGNSMDSLQSDIDCIGTNISELILEESLEEIVRNCVNVGMEFERLFSGFR